jgi:hypothetical protein
LDGPFEDRFVGRQHLQSRPIASCDQQGIDRTRRQRLQRFGDKGHRAAGLDRAAFGGKNMNVVARLPRNMVASNTIAGPVTSSTWQPAKASMATSRGFGIGGYCRIIVIYVIGPSTLS